MKSNKNQITFKLIIIAVITLFLLVLSIMVGGLISERELIQKDAVEEVSKKWSGEQIIIGPIISIPYYKYVKEISENGNKEKIVQTIEYYHFLPSELNVNGDIKPEKRYRGIYEVIVYNSNIILKGKFKNLNFSTSEILKNNLLLDRAEFVIGINDLKGIEKVVELDWGNKNILFNPGVTSNDVVKSGINANIKINPNDSSVYNFAITLDLKGSQLLYFTPVGKVTDVELNSNWQNPSFGGKYLPDKRNISSKGFKANWNILHLNRNYPQVWIGSQHKIEKSSFGVDLILPVNNYQKSYRAIQYSILFIGLTFLVFFLIEVINKTNIHPFQYILVGVSLIIFYTLLVSISEHIKFNFAYIIAALATILLITTYIRAILKSNKLTILISGILTLLYTFTFIIIQLQDYALLFGSIGIFIIMGFVMYFTRRIDWYNSNFNDSSQ